MDQKQSDVLTLIHLIKTESAKTREDLAETFETKFKDVESKLRKEMRQGFEGQKSELKEYIDDKVETLRRDIVDGIQNFQDAVITEVREIRQETAVNASHRKILTDHETRLTKVETHLFSN